MRERGESDEATKTNCFSMINTKNIVKKQGELMRKSSFESEEKLIGKYRIYPWDSGNSGPACSCRNGCDTKGAGLTCSLYVIV